MTGLPPDEDGARTAGRAAFVGKRLFPCSALPARLTLEAWPLPGKKRSAGRCQRSPSQEAAQSLPASKAYPCTAGATCGRLSVAKRPELACFVAQKPP